MRWSEVRTQLLPRSGVGVVAPWLMIAPPGNPVIRLDLRLLDRVEIRPEGEPDDQAAEPDESPHDRLCDVLLVCGDLEVALHIADGPEAAERIVQDAAPLTRGTADSVRAPAIEAVNHALPLIGGSDQSSPPVGKLVVWSSTPDAELTAIDELAGKVYELTLPQMIVGRTDEDDIVIVHRSISRHHAKVTRDPETGRYTIEDLQASNGVRVNGQDHAKVELSDGDTVDLGHVRIRFDSGEDPVIPSDPPVDLDQFLVIGRDPVLQRGEYIQVGKVSFLLDEVGEYALQGGNLPLPAGHLLQAAMAMLVVAAAERDAYGRSRLASATSMRSRPSSSG